ncbi:MAG TPA: hypothetical protein EYN51_10785, partial [Flavobacteriales bacterium]|nr:hypothetical protein [Flavobacteriales bacterium]
MLGLRGTLFGFDPWEERLADIIIDNTDEDRGPLERAILEYMATDSNDSRGEAMFKRALEGFGVGFAVEGIGRFGIGAVKQSASVV